MTDTPEAVRLADFALSMQTHLGAWRDNLGEDDRKAWDDYDAMAALLRRFPEIEAKAAKVTAYEVHCAQLEVENDQLRAELEKVRAPEGWRLVPAEPTEAMLDRAVAFALNVHLSSGYGWTQYMRDLWGRLLSGLAAAPTPPHADQKGQ